MHIIVRMGYLNLVLYAYSNMKCFQLYSFDDLQNLTFQVYHLSTCFLEFSQVVSTVYFLPLTANQNFDKLIKSTVHICTYSQGEKSCTSIDGNAFQIFS